MEVDTRAPAEQRRNNYNRFVRKAQLTTIVLESVTYKSSPGISRIPKSEIKRSVVPKEIDSYYSSDEGVCAAKILWVVQVRHKRKVLASCKAEYVVMYDSIPDFDKEIADLFIENVARISSYAYFRGLFAHLDWAAEGRSPPLPVFRSNPKV